MFKVILSKKMNLIIFFVVNLVNLPVMVTGYKLPHLANVFVSGLETVLCSTTLILAFELVGLKFK